MPSLHFGAYGVDHPSSAPNHGKRRFLVPLPHTGDFCSCHTCDGLRVRNAAARTAVNWSPSYPPVFYSVCPPEPEPEPERPLPEVEPVPEAEWW